MVTSWRHRLSSLYGESTRRNTKKKNNSWRSFNNTWATHQNDSWNHSEFTNILPCHFIHVIINTCGACKNIVTHPIEVLPCKKVICRDCCSNLVSTYVNNKKKQISSRLWRKFFAIQFFSSHTNMVYVFLTRKLLNGRAAVNLRSGKL